MTHSAPELRRKPYLSTFGFRKEGVCSGYQLEQGGFVWAALDFRVFTDPADENDWVAFEIIDLTATNFSHPWDTDGQPETPDFSDTGGEIRFGVATGTSCPATSDCTVTVLSEVHIDDWMVTVFDEDDPSGGGGMGGDGGTAGGGPGGSGGSAGVDGVDGGCDCRVPTATSQGNGLFPFFLVAFVGVCLVRLRRRR